MSTESAHTDPSTGPGQGGNPFGHGAPDRPLYRPNDQGMLTGTAAGIARYTGIDPTIVRVAFVALAILGGTGLPLYLAAWLLIPEEGADQSIAAHLLGHARATFGPTYPT